MWLFLTRRLRILLFAAVAGPILGWALNRAGRKLAQRNGETRVSRGLQTAGRHLNKQQGAKSDHIRPVDSGHADDLATDNQQVLADYEGRRVSG